jgi:uncharacterized membrane protein
VATESPLVSDVVGRGLLHNRENGSRSPLLQVSELVVVAFESESSADERLLDATRLMARNLLRMSDAATAVKTRRGKLRVRQTTEISGRPSGRVDGWWGFLITLLIGGPVGAAHYGQAFDELYGNLDELGIESNFAAELSETLEPGHSALFVLIEEDDFDAMIFGQLDGVVFQTPFPERAATIINQAMRPGRGGETGGS